MITPVYICADPTLDMDWKLLNYGISLFLPCYMSYMSLMGFIFCRVAPFQNYIQENTTMICND